MLRTTVPAETIWWQNIAVDLTALSTLASHRPEGDFPMPKIKANFTMNYEQQGSGDPIILIPYLTADHGCYAFQVPEFSKHFTCISLDLRGTGDSDDPNVPYSTETLADDVASFMDALGIDRAHFFGLSLGTGVGLWMGAKYPNKVRSLSLHSPWAKSDAFLKTILENWRLSARALASVPETVILSIFPWCFTPELYAAKPEYILALSDFVRSRPAQSLDSFLKQSDAARDHDVEVQLSRINAPTQITFGRHDLVTSTRFADRMQRDIRNCDLHIFEGCAHAPLYEKVDEFNQVVLQFLQGRTITRAA